MPHENSVFRDMLKLVDWDAFEQASIRHGAAGRARGLSCKAHLVAMLYGQLTQATSLRAIEAGLHSHARRLYHLGGRPVSRSSLADANRYRPVRRSPTCWRR